MLSCEFRLDNGEAKEPEEMDDVVPTAHGEGEVAADAVASPWPLLRHRRRYLHFLRREYDTSRTLVEREVILAEWIGTQNEVAAILRGC